MDPDCVDLKEEHLQLAQVKENDSCRLELIEILPRARDIDACCTAECVSGDWSAEVKQDIMAIVKQESDDVCFVI